MQQTFNKLIGEVRGAVRFRWPALLAAWAICAVGWSAVMLLPNVYESHARVFADTRTALGSMIQGLAIQQDVGAQLTLVQESLLGDAQLTRVIRETGLARDAQEPEDLLKAKEKLEENITIRVERSGNLNEVGGMVYWIAYRDRDRDRSVKVVEMLLATFMEDTLSGKMQNSETAQRFLVAQIRENEERLRESERRLAEFKKRNVGTMPGAEGDYFTRLQNEIDLNRKARTALSVALTRREELTRQLKEGASVAAASGASAIRPVAPDGRPVAAGDTAGRLMEARAKLADLLSQYTERHPAVSALRKEIADLEERRQRELEALRRGDPEAVASTGASANPVYQSIQLALNEVGVEIASLRGEIGQHEQKIAELQRLVKTVPEVEAEFARLNRDYDVTKTQYLALLERLEQARLGQDAEATGSGIKLQVLNPPNVPIWPVSPRRSLLVVAIMIFGAIAGAALAYVLARMYPVFDHARELEEVTGRPVLGVVSLATLDDRKVDLRRSNVRYAASAAALVAVFLAVLIVSRVAPDLLAIA
jgi:polysaccharide chain length determinant protein (PEP-CTERM system associated)